MEEKRANHFAIGLPPLGGDVVEQTSINGFSKVIGHHVRRVVSSEGTPPPPSTLIPLNLSTSQGARERGKQRVDVESHIELR